MARSGWAWLLGKMHGSSPDFRVVLRQFALSRACFLCARRSEEHNNQWRIYVNVCCANWGKKTHIRGLQPNSPLNYLISVLFRIMMFIDFNIFKGRNIHRITSWECFQLIGQKIPVPRIYLLRVLLPNASTSQRLCYDRLFSLHHSRPFGQSFFIHRSSWVTQWVSLSDFLRTQGLRTHLNFGEY